MLLNLGAIALPSLEENCPNGVVTGHHFLSLLHDSAVLLCNSAVLLCRSAVLLCNSAVLLCRSAVSLRIKNLIIPNSCVGCVSAA